MSIISRYAELDDLGQGRFRHFANVGDIAFLKNGSYTRILDNFVDGYASNPHVVDEAPFFSRITAQGDWQVHPTRDPNIWFRIGAPFTNTASPTRVSLNSFTRSGNVLTSVNTNFDARIHFARQLLKLEFQLKTAQARSVGQVAFPISAQGVTRSGTALQVNGVTIMNLTPPVVYDAANRFDVRPIVVTTITVSGQMYLVYTLPSLTGMTSPVVDPTLTLQPGPSDGKNSQVLASTPTVPGGSLDYIGAYSTGTPNYRFFLQFDVSPIPPTATVSAAPLTLYPFPSFQGAITVDLNYLTRSWVAADATWNKANSSTNWTTAGGDFNVTASASQTLAADGNFSQDLATLVQAWVSSAITNNGVVGKPSNEVTNMGGIFWKSSNNATAAERPLLVITYSIPGSATGGLTSGLSGLSGMSG